MLIGPYRCRVRRLLGRDPQQLHASLSNWSAALPDDAVPLKEVLEGSAMGPDAGSCVDGSTAGPSWPSRPSGTDPEIGPSVRAGGRREHEMRCDWLSELLEGTLRIQSEAQDLQPAIETAAEVLDSAGFCAQRVSLAVVTHHPGISGLAYVWNSADRRVVFFERPWGFLDSPEHLESPLHYVISTSQRLFIDKETIRCDKRFPIIESFVAQGATSYLALPLKTARGDVHVLAFWTSQPDGWTEEEADEMSRIVPLFTLLVELAENRRLLGIIGSAHEITQRALAEQALRNADEMLKQKSAAMIRLEAERDARLETERLLAERNAELAALAVSLEFKVSERTHELEKALQARSRFLALMSHELRTPMHALLALSELLSHTSLDSAQHHYVETIQTTGKGLLSLLNSILDFSKIEAGRVELEKVAIQPKMLLDEVTTLLGVSAKERGITLNVRCASDIPPYVEADPTRLRQVWMNLLSNSIKFVERGQVTATLEVASKTEQTCTLRGIVADTGPGIAPEAIGRLFEPFVQADETMTRRFGGTGLGLAICKGLLEQMGGSLSVESELGVGTTFTFLVPVTIAPWPPEPARSVASSKPEPVSFESTVRVLVVDDNKVNRLVAERQLRTLGVVEPILAAGGAEALEIVKQAEDLFDVVLMDVQMPEMDGLECTRRLRALSLQRQPWVIAMTANAFEADRQACEDAGMDDFLPKPVALPALREALQHSLPRGGEG